jgi:RNA polymerase sigma-70 factor (ECF subfamily)
MTPKGQEQIFIEWMKDHQGIFYKVAYAFADGNQIEDLVQELRLAVWKSVPSFSSKSKASTFIYRVCLNRAISLQRKNAADSRKLEACQTHLDVTGISNEGPNPLLDRIYAEIKQLTPLERSIILLHLEGWSCKEIAENFNMSVNLVGVRLNRIKKQLTTNLGE